MTPAQDMQWKMFCAGQSVKTFRMKIGPGINDENLLEAKIAYIELLTKRADKDTPEDRHGFIIIVHAGEYEFEIQQEFDVDDDPRAVNMAIEAMITQKIGFKVGGNLIGGKTDPMQGIHNYTNEELKAMEKPMATEEDPEEHMDRPGRKKTATHVTKNNSTHTSDPASDLFKAATTAAVATSLLSECRAPKLPEETFEHDTNEESCDSVGGE